jgi:hypothetical protein
MHGPFAGSNRPPAGQPTSLTESPNQNPSREERKKWGAGEPHKVHNEESFT